LAKTKESKRRDLQPLSPNLNIRRRVSQRNAGI